MTTDETPKIEDDNAPADVTPRADAETQEPQEPAAENAGGEQPEPKEPVTLDDLKEAGAETVDRLKSAGLAAFIDPVIEGLGDITRKAFSGLGKLLDEIDDRKRKP